MPERPDYAALIAGHTEVVDLINSGDSGLRALNQLLRVAQRTVDAAAMIFVEYGPTVGRVVAATGEAEWAVGRPVPRDDPDTARMLAGPRTQRLCVSGLSGDIAEQMRARDIGRMVVARSEIAGQTIGSLHAAYFGEDDVGGELCQAVLTYLASCVAHMYGDQVGLPVHGNGPVVAALADGLAIIDRDGAVRLWNPAAEQVTGQPAKDMIGRPLPFPVPLPGQVADHRLPDGRWLKVTSGELPGPVPSRVVTFRDVTDQHLREHDRDLFVAVTSHELRTPVTVIKGYAETLSRHWQSLSDNDRRLAAQVIGQRAGELARLLDRLLSAANDPGPVGASPPQSFDLVRALRQAAGELPAHLRARLSVELPADLPMAFGDRASMSTVLTELVTNAGKYSPPGSPIELTAEAEGHTVAFRVSDRGEGINPEHVERAFDRFWQGEQGDRRRYPGAGLGLYLVRQIVERQKGWVSLRPRDGGGTVAEVRLARG
jgi:nitrogen-specific signal transduction histidine kinase